MCDKYYFSMNNLTSFNHSVSFQFTVPPILFSSVLIQYDSVNFFHYAQYVCILKATHSLIPLTSQLFMSCVVSHFYTKEAKNNNNQKLC